MSGSANWAALLAQVHIRVSYMFFCSRDAERDCIDLHRSVLTPLASIGNGGKLYVYKMSSGFWTQVKNAGLVIVFVN